MQLNLYSSPSRIEWVDALRGFALLGILLANVPVDYHSEMFNADPWFMIGGASSNACLEIFFHWFIDKKFITIFSILFGFGFSIQLSLAREKGIHFGPYFLIRMLLLLVIGSIHAYILWFGDILRDYAICGILLLVFVNKSNRNLLRIGIFLSVFMTALIFILNGVFEMNSNYSYDPAIIGELEYAASYIRYLKINFTIDPFVNFIHDSPLTLSFALGCMLIGFWMERTGFFHSPSKHLKHINQWIWTGCTFGLLGSIGFWLVISGRWELDLPFIWLVFLIVGGMLIQSLAYIGLFTRLHSQTALRKILNLFVPIGRMALTNYVLQSVFFIITFFHWFPGFRLYGKISMIESWLLALLFFGLQVLLSRYWLKQYTQGPLEFLWRKLSYRFYLKYVRGQY